MTDALHLFREDESGETYAARDLAHAKELWKEDTGQDPDGGTDWVAVPDDKPITVHDEDGSTERKTASEWANADRSAFGERGGGCVFGTNW